MDIELKKFFKKLLFSSSLLITYHASQITFRDRSSPTEIKRGNHGGGGGTRLTATRSSFSIFRGQLDRRREGKGG